MKKNEFEHTIRAAGAILGTNDLLVIGSQAIHASVDFIIPEAERSIEVDIAVLTDTDGSKADLIDGSIGELSMFQETFGYYAQGVSPKTAILPDGWKKRLVAYKNSNTNGVTAHCLEIHDLWISKAIAHRQKDIEFCKALLKKKLVQSKTLAERLNRVKDIKPEMHRAVRLLIDSKGLLK
jgi:hypothetical protein